MQQAHRKMTVQSYCVTDHLNMKLTCLTFDSRLSRPVMLRRILQQGNIIT